MAPFLAPFSLFTSEAFKYKAMSREFSRQWMGGEERGCIFSQLRLLMYLCSILRLRPRGAKQPLTQGRDELQNKSLMGNDRFPSTESGAQSIITFTSVCSVLPGGVSMGEILFSLFPLS